MDAAAAGALTAAYGAGNLLGSAGVMVRPATGDADILTSRLAFVVGVGLVAVWLAPNLWVAIAAYAVSGIANAYFFASTLAARSEYAPRAARGQVFIWVGALKITAGSAGTAAAGILISVGPTFAVLVGALGIGAAVLASLLDRRGSR